MQHPFYNEMIPQRNNSLIRDIEMATIYSAGNYNQPVIVHSTKTTTTTTTEIIESISPMFSPTPTPRPRLSHNFTHSPVIPQIMDIPPNIGRASFPTSRQSLPQNSSRN